MREYIGYIHRINKILHDIIMDMVGMFQENNEYEVVIPYPQEFDFKSEICGEGNTRDRITEVWFKDGMIILRTENGENRYLYQLIDKTDYTLIYDNIYYHFYSK